MSERRQRSAATSNIFQIRVTTDNGLTAPCTPVGTSPHSRRSTELMAKAAIFDLDGTLVDSNELHVNAWTRAFENAGRPVAPDKIRRQIGKGTDNLVPALIPGADNALIERLGDEHGRIFKGEHLRAVEPFDGAGELIVATHSAGMQVVFASSASQEEVDHYINLLGVGDLVTATTSIDDVEHSKPAPDIFRAALRKLGCVAPADAVVIGDTPYDIEAAAAAGIAAIAVRSGGFADLDLVGAAAIYDDVKSLLANLPASPLMTDGMIGE